MAAADKHVRRLALAGFNDGLNSHEVYVWLCFILKYDHATCVTALSWAKAEHLRRSGAPQLPLEGTTE